MFAETDLKTGATYAQLIEAPVARTVHVSDVIMVDLDEDDTPVGIEFAVPVRSVTRDDWYALAKIEPEVKSIFKEVFPL